MFKHKQSQNDICKQREYKHSKLGNYIHKHSQENMWLYTNIYLKCKAYQ